VEQSYAEALKWYLLAAEQGDGNAMGHIGNMYVQGTHVKACNTTALKYFRQGADKGNGIAINGLGYMNMYGLGLQQSFTEAMKLFSTAAEQGNLEARFNLGALYVGGHGVSKDYAKAIYYFTLAANRGHMLALYNLAMMHLNGFGTPRSCPNALQFLKSVGERGSWGLRLQQAYKLYHRGKQDEALLLYLEAAELGYEVGQGNVAYIYDEGGTPLSANKKHKALSAYENSALQGNAAAELKIGDYYYYGLGTAVNYRKAVAHYRAARYFFSFFRTFFLTTARPLHIAVPRGIFFSRRLFVLHGSTGLVSCVLQFDTNVRRATPRRCSTSSSCICAMFV
jgi:TPR repeat protein